VTESRNLPLLSERVKALETCAYCPKLCRAACPVSTAEASETVTPWGKMSLAWFALRGDVPVDIEHADAAWACTTCFGCRDRCDHKNPVAHTLLEARADFYKKGVAPPAAKRVVEEHPTRMKRLNAHVAKLGEVLESQQRPEGESTQPTQALLLGCQYVQSALDEGDDETSEALDALHVAQRLFGSVRLVTGCCGQSLATAGDRDAAIAAQRDIVAQLEGIDELIVLDPGCAATLTHLPTKVRTLVEAASDHIDRLNKTDLLDGRTVRWHDPCQLSRGLGVTEEPRALLGRATGREPSEFPYNRELGNCSGGGGLLPITRPTTAKAIAAARVAEHRAASADERAASVPEADDGVIVTACASSLRQFRAAGADAVDLVTLLRAGFCDGRGDAAGADPGSGDSGTA